jgi:hypothetical protein
VFLNFPCCKTPKKRDKKADGRLKTEFRKKNEQSKALFFFGAAVNAQRTSHVTFIMSVFIFIAPLGGIDTYQQRMGLSIVQAEC